MVFSGVPRSFGVSGGGGRGVPRSFGVSGGGVAEAYPGVSEGGGWPRRTQEFRRGGGGRGVPRSFGGGPRSTKQANKPNKPNKPNKRATELKPCTCAHQGSMFRPY